MVSANEPEADRYAYPGVVFCELSAVDLQDPVEFQFPHFHCVPALYL